MTMNFQSWQHIYRRDKTNRRRRWYYFFLILGVALLFVPWTQNIRARGNVTALRQEDRPQELPALIGGRVERWFVKEGDYVRRGDTLVQLSEVKADYLDPALLSRTQQQLEAKKATVDYYRGKARSTETQMGALQASLPLKLQQLSAKLRQQQVKATADSMDFVAARNDAAIAAAQSNRARSLYDSGLISLTQFEQRNAAQQNAVAKRTAAENKYYATLQEIGITRIEANGVEQDYREKVAKVEGDRYTSMSQVAGGDADIAKLQNQYASYSIRNGMYYVLAPQDGQVVRARNAGIGEVVKEGEALMHFVPAAGSLAVELFVRPVDLPLLHDGQEVRFVFDGFPAIVFSGWPEASYGVFSGKISAIERDLSPGGLFKVLVREDSAFRRWPAELRIGAGANGIALLRNVPLWYELWRNINSFPPDYYTPPATKKEGGK
ncbi:MAG: HlyD family efflux transporter periplasmic adaptor subunit [Chitinophagaceae bacterium]|nr:MAG: HlyD family efflux transporter periplasmic adaptor subunit [Chitinophagaceae bacterium]